MISFLPVAFLSSPLSLSPSPRSLCLSTFSASVAEKPVSLLANVRRIKFIQKILTVSVTASSSGSSAGFISPLSVWLLTKGNRRNGLKSIKEGTEMRLNCVSWLPCSSLCRFQPENGSCFLDSCSRSRKLRDCFSPSLLFSGAAEPSRSMKGC